MLDKHYCNVILVSVRENFFTECACYVVNLAAFVDGINGCLQSAIRRRAPIWIVVHQRSVLLLSLQYCPSFLHWSSIS